MFAYPATDDFLLSRIDHMLDLRHPLAVLACRMPLQEIEARAAQVFSRKGRVGMAMSNLSLFGEQAPRSFGQRRRAALCAALKANPQDVREQYERQLKDLQEAYGEAMLELRARKQALAQFH